MASFRVFSPNVEVNGITVLSVVAGMLAKELAFEILGYHGISDIRADSWFSQQSWLNAFKEISQSVGPLALFSIGKRIPDNADWPANINSIDTALPSIDVAYHMNHRINGIVMCDPATGNMLEGIGHYLAVKSSDREMKVICDNPYPCQFDRGIVLSAAEKFKAAGTIVTLVEDAADGCRAHGGKACTFVVRW